MDPTHLKQVRSRCDSIRTIEHSLNRTDSDASFELIYARSNATTTRSDDPIAH